MFGSRICVALLALLLVADARRSSAESVRVMTFNIRYGTAADGENSWPHRRELLMKVIRDYDPDVLGVQEAIRSQVDELAAAFPQFSVNGVGREAGGGGEYSAIFYRRQRFDLAAAGTEWLSDSPQIPGSKTWGNNLPRICTWMRVLDRTNDRRFWVFNTHWDHQSQDARVKSGEAIAKRLAAQTGGQEPALVMGDLNAAEKNAAIRAVTRDGELLTDTFRTLHPDAREAGTFSGFTGKPGADKIDYIFVTRGWRVVEAEIRHDHDGARYPSDHFPVVATVTLDDSGAKP